MKKVNTFCFLINFNVNPNLRRCPMRASLQEVRGISNSTQMASWASWAPLASISYCYCCCWPSVTHSSPCATTITCSPPQTSVSGQYNSLQRLVLQTHVPETMTIQKRLKYLVIPIRGFSLHAFMYFCCGVHFVLMFLTRHDCKFKYILRSSVVRGTVLGKTDTFIKIL